MSVAERRRRRPIEPETAIWLVIAVLGWGLLISLGVAMFSSTPRTAGFDLELVLRAGRAIAAGTSPYDPAIVAGRSPDAVGLFYSYPPLVAQAFGLVASVGSGALLVGLGVLATGLFLVTVDRLRALVAPGRARAGFVIAAAASAVVSAPFFFAVLFGNLDALFPALYGFALIGALSPRLADRVTGGVALALAAVTKLYPAGLGLWFLVRAARDRDRRPVVVIAAVVAGLVLLGLSLLAGGGALWREYLSVVSVAGRAEIVDGRNLGPAAQLALLVGGGSDLARTIHLAVAAVAVVAVAWAAWTRPDPVESLAIAAAATLFLLPVTWVHYPAAMLPFAAAAVLRSTSVAGAAAPSARAAIRGLLIAAGAIAAVALAWLPLLWVAVGLVLVAVHRSIPSAAQPQGGGA